MMKPSMEFMSNVCSVLGHINRNIEETKITLLLEKKVDSSATTYNLVLKGQNDADVFTLASDLTDEQLKWYVFGLGDGMGLKPEKLEIA
ncbi:hypothetical protein OF66_2617 [Seleniivibrio woodruffii]|uniref:Uncharacterized protein n=2 Tax=Seleniivibrio woodruffii TaxID=1078050 RepID=A0A4R1KF07_9BACT|nr:hypothetical protein [Seleniivibrio woodruffii]TCK62603.1 hypothetical protein C8D98_1132 [Seleniivibrio woodruffii]TVZ36971.1 hypothetical protein OF66_2617 [Seleniivibrio woodruffii]